MTKINFLGSFVNRIKSCFDSSDRVCVIHIVYIRFLPSERDDSRLGQTESLLCIAIISYLYSDDHYIHLTNKTSGRSSSITIAFKFMLQNRKFYHEWIFMWSIECQLFRSWLKKVLRNFKIKRTVRSFFEKAKTLRIQLPGELACEKWCWWFSYNFVNQIIWDNCHEFWDNWYEFTGWSILQIHVLLFALQWHKLTQNWCEFNALTQDWRSIPRFRHMHKNTNF